MDGNACCTVSACYLNNCKCYSSSVAQMFIDVNLYFLWKTKSAKSSGPSVCITVENPNRTHTHTHKKKVRKHLVFFRFSCSWFNLTVCSLYALVLPSWTQKVQTGHCKKSRILLLFIKVAFLLPSSLCTYSLSKYTEQMPQTSENMLPTGIIHDTDPQSQAIVDTLVRDTMGEIVQLFLDLKCSVFISEHQHGHGINNWTFSSSSSSFKSPRRRSICDFQTVTCNSWVHILITKPHLSSFKKNK